jgi:glutathione S-transferase
MNFRFLERHALAIHGGPYWLGDEFSLADVAFFPWFEQLAVLERFRKFVMPAECNRILAWREVVAVRRGVQAMVRSSHFYVHGYAQLLGRITENVSAA